MILPFDQCLLERIVSFQAQLLTVFAWLCTFLICHYLARIEYFALFQGWGEDQLCNAFSRGVGIPDDQAVGAHASKQDEDRAIDSLLWQYCVNTLKEALGLAGAHDPDHDDELGICPYCLPKFVFKGEFLAFQLFNHHKILLHKTVDFDILAVSI